MEFRVSSTLFVPLVRVYPVPEWYAIPSDTLLHHPADAAAASITASARLLLCYAHDEGLSEHHSIGNNQISHLIEF